DTATNKEFVAAFKKAYGRTPTLYASQGYDGALLIASALKAVNGDMSKVDQFRKALEKADFPSVRGNFSFGNNNHPVQDIYVRKVIKDENGNFTNQIVQKVFTNHADAYAKECVKK
ncbi:MAG: ABC transporter substrate-binding protein, partial [Campylobacterota bacterium]|nr:ABC transporter substrate-binding protein [Campylobacterota bacterium]